MRKATTILTSLMLLVASACGSSQDVVSGPGDGAGGGDVPAGDLPGSNTPGEAPLDPGGVAEGPGPLVVSIERGGGLQTAGAGFRTLPQVAVYEDGTTLSPGAMIAIYPGPALPAVTRGQLGEGVVADLVAAAADAGLLDDTEEDFGDPTVMDAGTTTITVVADGTTYVTGVYALDDTGGELPGITPDQQRARARVGAFVNLVSGTVTGATGAEGKQYDAERYRVLPLALDQEIDPDVAPDTRDWPLPDVVLQEGECTAVEGQQADELGEALQTATEITRWRTAPGETLVLAVRPVLPHEPGCPE